MSRYLNCGASTSNRRGNTKAELRALMREDPSLVTFDATSMFDHDGTFKGDAIPAGVTLSVTAQTLTAKGSGTRASAATAAVN